MKNKYKYINQKIQLDKEQKLELDQFNEKWDSDYKRLESRWEEIFARSNEQQEEEVKIKAEEFENKYPKNPKPTSETINLNKTLEHAIKNKE